MKRLNVTVCCQAYYKSSILVPDEMNFDEAIEYAKEHLDEITVEGELEYTPDSDMLDEENCDLNDEPEEEYDLND